MRRVEGITGLVLGLSMLIVTMSAGVALTAGGGGDRESSRVRSTTAQPRVAPGIARAPLAAVSGAVVGEIAGTYGDRAPSRRVAAPETGRSTPARAFSAPDAEAALDEAALAADPAAQVAEEAAAGDENVPVTRARERANGPVARASKTVSDALRRSRKRSRRSAATARRREKDIIARVPAPSPASRPSAPAVAVPVTLSAAAAPAEPLPSAVSSASSVSTAAAGERYDCERDVRSADDVRVECDLLSPDDPRYATARPLNEQTAGATRVDLDD